MGSERCMSCASAADGWNAWNTTALSSPIAMQLLCTKNAVQSDWWMDVVPLRLSGNGPSVNGGGGWAVWSEGGLFVCKSKELCAIGVEWIFIFGPGGSIGVRTGLWSKDDVRYRACGIDWIILCQHRVCDVHIVFDGGKITCSAMPMIWASVMLDCMLSARAVCENIIFFRTNPSRNVLGRIVSEDRARSLPPRRDRVFDVASRETGWLSNSFMSRMC